MQSRGEMHYSLSRFSRGRLLKTSSIFLEMFRTVKVSDSLTPFGFRVFFVLTWTQNQTQRLNSASHADLFKSCQEQRSAQRLSLMGTFVQKRAGVFSLHRRSQKESGKSNHHAMKLKIFVTHIVARNCKQASDFPCNSSSRLSQSPAWLCGVRTHCDLDKRKIHEDSAVLKFHSSLLICIEAALQ